MEVLRFFLFGHPRLERDDQPVAVNRRKMIALLSYLLITRQPHSREALATLFWPDFDTSSALANLRRDLSRLKEILGAGLLQIEREKVQVNPEADLWLDVWEFEGLLRQIEQHEHHTAGSASSTACSHCQALREAAAALYNGDFLAGFNLPDSPAFDDWQFYHSERLRGQLADVLVQMVNANIAQGSYEKAIEPARRWLALDPLHEPAQRMLMQLYAWAAQPTAALRQYNLLVDLLQQELGAEPEAETTSLYEAIRSRRLETPAPQAPAAVPIPGTPEPQQKVSNRFRVDSLLSSGGFGEIFLGYDQQTGNTVAIKRLHPQLVASNPTVVERFVREGKALSQLSHPNIIPLLAFYEHEGSYNLVMEYLPGGTLRNRLEREHALPVEQAVEIALELADALSRAHHLHILHRDLKPENILLDGNGHPRLIDFGLAQLQGNDSRLTQAGMLLGSPAYMSPEAIQGKELDQRSDVWSFGVLLFEMLAGRLPFEGEQFHSLMNQVLNEEAPSLLQYCPDIHPALAQLVASMLEKDRDQRLPGMRQAAAQLEAIRAGKAAVPQGANSGRARSGKTSTPSSPAYLVELPHQPAPIVGRASELDDLIELLHKPDVRLVTLVGTGGIGKTRLAVEVASQMAKTLPNGAVFVPLAPVSEADSILPAIANALHFRFSPGANPKEQLARRLNGQKMLLVFDNFEHLLGAAGLVAEILAAAADIQVVVTSRERLGLVEEWVYELGGLPFPVSSEQVPGSTDSWLKDFSAVQLFIERARRSDPKFTVDAATMTDIIHICQLVEGMPLAIELAAPWVRAMSCAEIAQELLKSLDILTTSMRNLPNRHRSMRVVFDQSWQALTPAEQDLLARLAIFQNGCNREAAENVAGARPAVLMALVDKALLRHRAKRYEMHELVRQYASERLSQNSQQMEDAHDRHHRYYLELLRQANSGLKGGRQLETSEELTADIDNIRAAWNHAVQRKDRQALAQAAESYWLYSEFRGTLAQGEAAFRLAAEIVQPPAGDPVLAGFLYAAQGCMLARQWDYEQGSQLMTRGLSLLRQADPYDPEKMAFALAWMAFVHVMYGQFPQAERAAQESLDHFPQTGDQWTRAGALRLLGAAALYQGNIRQAHEYLNQCVAVCESIGEMRIHTYATTNLGVVHLWYGEMDAARQYFEESLQISKTCNDRLSRADAISEHVRFFMATGEYDQAVETAQKSVEIYHELGRAKVSLANIVLGKALRLKGLPGAEEALREGLNCARQVNHRPDTAWGLEGMGSLAMDRQDYDQAQSYFNEALEIWTEIGNEPEIATLLCRSAFGLLVAESPDRASIFEKLSRALKLARKHQVVPIALTAMIGLATLQMQDGDPGLAAPILLHAKKNPATPQEVRGWVERLIKQLPAGLSQPDVVLHNDTWSAILDRLVQQVSLA